MNIEHSLRCLGHDLARAVWPAADRTIHISVIIPCYNSASFLRPCLESHAIQTLPQSAFEVICVDDCSTDDTITIIQSYQNRISNLHVVKHPQNRKQGAARNTGIDMARGRFVTLVDSDDFLCMDALEVLLHTAKEGADVVISQLLKVRYDGPYRPVPAPRKIIESTEISVLENKIGWFPVSMLISRKLLNDGKIRFREDVYFEDIDFCIKVFLCCHKCAVISDFLYYYVQRDSSTVNLMSEKKLTDSALAIFSVVELIKNRKDLLTVFRKIANSWLCLQATRVRDGHDSDAEKQRLGQHFKSETDRLGVSKLIGGTSAREIVTIAGGQKKSPAPLAAKNEITCTSPWGGRFESDFDLTYTKRLILENFGFGVPTFGFYEGINDDLNMDRALPRRPYRSLDYLLLPGIYQQAFYADRECRIVGLPNVRARLAASYVSPKIRRAIINVNFTYGVLEDRRDIFIESAVQACNELSLDYVIAQHPADKADLSRFNVSSSGVYDLLDEGKILISRFSTTILEALAMGRPVVYHNPIGETVPKFQQPLGAYSVSRSTEELKFALRHELTFLDSRGDVRSRAALFLHFHCNVEAADDPASLAAQAIADVLASPPKRFAFKTENNETWIDSAPSGLNKVSSAVDNQRSYAPAVRTRRNKYRAALTLSRAAADLLLDPATGLARLTDADIATQIAEAIAALPPDDALADHFKQVQDFARFETS